MAKTLQCTIYVNDEDQGEDHCTSAAFIAEKLAKLSASLVRHKMADRAMVLIKETEEDTKILLDLDRNDL
jgi:hypothetical protein